jgi:DNA-directed RNA polymerase subunit RPC12/RpoP
MPLQCPECQSKNISKSKRRGLFESVVFPLIQVRPYRCMSCDLRFFRRAAPHEHSATTTSARSDFGEARSPVPEKENTVDRALVE